MTDWCALCGKPLVRLEHGAYLRCHKGLGYQSDVEPDPADAWAAMKTKRGLWLFIRPGYPKK